jgi:formylglycine-generating enzyme required for sulfatase activity
MRTLILFALTIVTCAACADEPAPTDAPDAPVPVPLSWPTHHPENAHEYADSTLSRFTKLVETDDWRDPVWNAQGTLEAEHEKTGLVFVLIPEGEFLMGSPENEAGRHNDETQHRVTVGAFLLSKTVCTQAAWRLGGGGKKSYFGNDDDRPVEQVTWKECDAWSRALGLRLPSEAEWEYACRAGTPGAIYSGRWKIVGECNAPALDPIAWYGGNSGVDFDHAKGCDSSDWPEKQYPHTRAGTRRVRLKLANPWGLHDMLGNVWEWCSSLYRPYPYDSADGRESLTGSGSRVCRGGGWSSLAGGSRSAFRCSGAPVPDFRLTYLGFRPAASLPE